LIWQIFNEIQGNIYDYTVLHMCSVVFSVYKHQGK